MREPRRELVDTRDRLRVRLVRLYLALDVCVSHDLNPVLQVVEHDNRFGEQEHGLGQAVGVDRGQRHARLEVVGALVGQVADRAAEEARQTLHGRDPVFAQLRFDERQRVAGAVRESRTASQGPVGLCAHEAVPRQALAAFHALEQEGVRAAGDLQVGGHRRLEVRDNVPVHRNEVGGALRKLPELLD